MIRRKIKIRQVIKRYFSCKLATYSNFLLNYGLKCLINKVKQINRVCVRANKGTRRSKHFRNGIERRIGQSWDCCIPAVGRVTLQHCTAGIPLPVGFLLVVNVTTVTNTYWRNSQHRVVLYLLLLDCYKFFYANITMHLYEPNQSTSHGMFI